VLALPTAALTPPRRDDAEPVSEAVEVEEVERA
jgi:hypothetical protein